MSVDTTGRRIVLLFGSETEAERSAALSSESSDLATLLENATKPMVVCVISLGLSRTIDGTSQHLRLDDARRSLTDRLLASLGAFALKARFASMPIGRLLNSLGPIDPSRVFWRTLKRHPEAMRLLKSSDVAIAADLAATKAAWLAVHRGWVDQALYDHRSASVGINWQLPSSVSR